MVSDLVTLIDAHFLLPDRLWLQVLAVLPVHPPSPRGGRPRADDRPCMEGVYYLTRTGIQWCALPRCFGPKSPVHDRFEEWVEAGVFRKLWKRGLLFYDEKVGHPVDLAVLGWGHDQGPSRR